MFNLESTAYVSYQFLTLKICVSGNDFLGLL
jgi:hypothetical protein